MKLGAIYTEERYPFLLSDPAVTARLVLVDVLRLCGDHRIEPVGELTVELDEPNPYFPEQGRALRWQFDPEETS